jgi:hypothetical protein
VNSRNGRELWVLSLDGMPHSFRRGDANDDGRRDISDPVATLEFLFPETMVLPCIDAADSNDDGQLDISDVVHILGFLFLAGPAPPEPTSACGPDPTPDAIDCARFSSC